MAVVPGPLLPGCDITRGTTLLPWLRVIIIAGVETGFDTARRFFTRSTSRQFMHELLFLLASSGYKRSRKAYLHLPIDGITTANSPRTAAKAIVTPVTTSLAIRTVTSHMSSITADTTDDVGSEVALLRAIVFAMTDLTTFFISNFNQTKYLMLKLTVLTSLVLIVTKSTVKSGQLPELIPLELVLAFGNRGGLAEG